MKTIKAFNANTQKIEKAILSIATNNELVIRFADESFFKLPASTTEKELIEHLEAYELSNTGQKLAEEEVDKNNDLEERFPNLIIKEKK